MTVLSLQHSDPQVRVRTSVRPLPSELLARAAALVASAQDDLRGWPHEAAALQPMRDQLRAAAVTAANGHLPADGTITVGSRVTWYSRWDNQHHTGTVAALDAPFPGHARVVNDPEPGRPHTCTTSIRTALLTLTTEPPAASAPATLRSAA